LLVVDDYESVRQLMAFLFARPGWRVCVVGSGRVALELSVRERVDAALIDVHMPGLDGFQTCAALQGQMEETGRFFPVWLMTAAVSEAAKRKAVEAGAEALLDKLDVPMDFAEILERYFATQ